MPAGQETQVRSVGQGDPLEKGIAIYSSILAWRIPWTEEHGGFSPWDRKELDMTEQLTLSLSFLLYLIEFNFFSITMPTLSVRLI